MEEIKNESLLRKFIRLAGKPKFYIPIIIIVGVSVYFLYRGDSKPAFELVKVVRKDLVEEVSATGKTKAVESVSLSFPKSGRVVSVQMQVGDKVLSGDVLARQDQISDVLALEKAEADLEAEQAVLLELVRGTRFEDLAILESKRASAEQSLKDAKIGMLDKIRDGYTRADDAVRNYADLFFDGGRTNNPSLNISVSDTQLKTTLNKSRFDVEKELIAWELEIKMINTESDFALSATVGRSKLSVIKDFLENLATAVNSLSVSQSISLTTLSSYRANISTARATINTALSGISSGEDILSGAEFDIDLSEKNLLLARAGTVPEKITVQEAKISALKASIASIRHTISDAVLRSPIKGTVTIQDAKVGEVAVANSPLVSIISDDGLLVEAFVPEVDIGNIVAGNQTDITLDAFPSENFSGGVGYVEPAETVIDGVPTYKVRFIFNNKDERIRPGMTANLTIKTAEKKNVLAVPQRVLKDSNGSKYAKILTSVGTVEEVKVTTGIRGATGEVEIISGIKEGDNVVVVLNL